MKTSALMGCPLCSAPPAHVARVYIVTGARSGRPIIAGCPHVSEVFPGVSNCGETAEALADGWNTWATGKLDEKLARYPATYAAACRASLKAE